MSDYESVYQIIDSNVLHRDGTIIPASVKISSTGARYLKEASPWIQFAGGMGFLAAGTIILLGLISFFGLFELSIFSQNTASLKSQSPNYSLGIVYLLLGGILVFPAKYAYSFGIKIGDFFDNGNSSELEQAFKHTKSLSKFYGFLMIGYLGVTIIALVLGIIGSIARLY